MTHSPVRFQVNPTSVPSLPSWMEEVAAVAHILKQTGIIAALEEHVRFARARFGTYDTIDFVIVLMSYALSGEPTLASFYDRLAPFSHDVAALFHRHRLPSRSALSRFLAALNEQTVEALRTQFLEDLLERATPFSHPGGVWDRRDQQYVVVDVDGTRQAARQRALPHLPTLPEPHRRLTQVAAPGYTGRKRGEVVRTRTTILQAHTHQWLGTFGGAGNGDLRGGLERACQLVISYATKQQLLPSQMLLRLDGAYGDTAVLSDVLEMGIGVIARSRDYALLGRPEVLAVLSRPPVVRWSHPESGMVRDLYDCASIRLLRGGAGVRVVIATHPGTDDPPKVGQQRDGVVYELFVSTLLAPTMMANDLLDLYLHRGSFETVLADEDWEQDPDRWCSQTSCGQEFWQILSQWIWNLRLECGQHYSPTSLRTTTFALANESVPGNEPTEVNATQPERKPVLVSRPAGGSSAVWDNELVYGPAQWAQPSFTGGFPGSAFLPQADGTLLCPAGRVLTLIEYRRERAGSVRVSYSASLDDCRSCHLRLYCQKRRTHRARRVSAVYWPVSSPSLPVPKPPPPASSPVLWRDWPRRSIRRQWMKIVRAQSVTITREAAPPLNPSQDPPSSLFTRPQRAHWRFSWEQRLSRNARSASSSPVTITLHGLPAVFAQIYGFELSNSF
ncbi:hypothetical protein KSF_074990 [Reticulibacter mediterranei]|uniref:Transposase DDE domain-containing protein n=1 Tax=Reticulibacter mediterranei TaxID=2778369 RepID=A0A8J3IMT6_9CHLR|nr:hypothetical protein [Reticulibacter mediterranei]GHO97451.1 hypothetical protein KSF_074990 [Reticulibacter mediterranei]